MQTLYSEASSGERSWFTIQEVADRTGLSAHTLRYYEKAGLLMPVERSEGGLRRYSERDIDGLLFVTRLRSTGMPIHKVRAYVLLRNQGDDTGEARRQMLEDHRGEVLQQIEELQQCLAAVEFKIELYKQGWVPQSMDDPRIQELRRLCTPPSKQQPNKE